MLAIHLPALASPSKFGKVASGILSDKNDSRLIGLYILLLSFITLSVHWRLTSDWLLTVSILGWLLFIKGLVYLWFPEVAQAKTKLLKDTAAISLVGLIGTGVAVFLLYVGVNLI